MKIKIIDLLNKISKGEEVPKKIKYNDEIWEYYKDLGDYIKAGKPNTLFTMYYIHLILNDEVEIIEEDKKIKKLPYYSLEKIQKSKNKDEWYENRLKLLEKRINDYHNKINELIDEINNLKEK